jgi:hypothetical protein
VAEVKEMFLSGGTFLQVHLAPFGDKFCDVHM